MQQKHLYIIVGTLSIVILTFVIFSWYFSRQKANLSTQNIVPNIEAKHNTISKNQENEAVRFQAKRKTYFHSSPDIKDVRKAYILEGDKGVFTSFNHDFGYALYTSSNGRTTEGWILLSDVEMSNR